MRIALFTYATQPRGGVAHTIELGNALHDLGHDVLLHGLDENGDGFFREPRCPYRLIRVDPVPGGIVPLVRARIAAYVDAWDDATPPFDIYHAHDGIGGNALATLAERGAIADFVRTVHHVDDFTNPTLAALQERSIRAATRCLVVSALWERLVRERFEIASDVVWNGVDLVRFTPPSPQARARDRKRFGFASFPIYLTVGGVEERKNTIGTLDAFARVRYDWPGAVLVVAGGASVFDHTPYRDAFAARAQTLGLKIGSSVVLLGVVPDADIPALIGAADAFVFPSLSEGFGLVVLEAMATGTPVVTSAIAPFTEYLTAREAILVNPRNTAALAAGMLRATEPQTRAELVEPARTVAERFTWEESARTHVARYEEVVRARVARQSALTG